MNLREARFIKRLNQWDLTKKTGIHQSVISLIENGYKIPTDLQKQKISNALNMNISVIEWPVRN